ncbi:MAG: hypothetical protein LBE12_17250 [Planctomycetaceae bacterium]|jgi:hypothetical protein|nr:hypothetical protein [Planctomycetaceae bacterium]
MEESYFNSHLENHPDLEENESEFSFIISNLPTRERHALETLNITSADVFCKYDFSELFAIRGYGETTVTRLQLLQKQIRSEGLPDKQNKYVSLTLQSPIHYAKLSNKELHALVLLNVMTIGEFLNLDLSETALPKGFGEKTRSLLAQSKIRIAQKLPIKLPVISPEEYSVLALPLNPREKRVLIKFHISNWRELACFDFYQIDDILNIGFGTLQALLSKQTEVRTKIIRAKMDSIDSIDSLSNFSYDNEYSVFLLDLTLEAKEALGHLGISRISELIKANLNILKFVNFPIKDTYEELYRIQQEFSQIIKKTGNPLNDFLASTPLTSLGISRIAAELLQQNAINSLQDFILFSIPETYPDLQQLQLEWQCRYAPTEFLRVIPSYFNILFYHQKSKTRNDNLVSYLNNFETAKDFLSGSFEDIMKLTQGNLEAVQVIQSFRYKLLRSCLDFYKCFDFSANDEREQGWKQEINKESLSVLPFFGGKPNRNFSAEMFHKTFLPGLGLDAIVQGRILQITKQIGIQSLGELLLITYSHFLFLKHCSKIKIIEVQKNIQKILFSITNDSTRSTGLTQTKIDHSVFSSLLSPLDKSTPKTLLIDLLRRYISSDRAIDIIAQRVQGKTLEQIAQMYGVTRERIRQIELKYKNPFDFVYAQGIFVEVGQMLEDSIIALKGFTTIHQIKTQFATDNGWSEQDCTQSFVKFLLDRVTDKIVPHGNGYYSTRSYPCGKCELLTVKVSGLGDEVKRDLVTRNNLLITLLKTCCSGCVDMPQRISEHFLDWKCFSDSLYSQLFGDDELYRSSERSMQKMVNNVLKRSAHPLHVKEILNLICYRTGNDHFTEKQVDTAVKLLSLKEKHIFLWDRGGVYAHRKHIPVDNPLLIVIEKNLKQLIKKAETPYILLYTLFSKYQSQCEAEGIPSVHALHACLKARDMLGVAFMRSPCVSVTNERHKRKNVEILENWVIEKGDIVTNLSLKHYARKIGLNSQQYNSTYVKSKLLVRYKHGLIVHLNLLDWNQTKQNSILLLARDYWNYCISQGLLYARTDQLLSEYENKFPKLAHGILWTSDLLFSLLSQSESVITFGNTHLAYGFKNNISAPQTLGDIIIEILKRKFNGKTKLSKISAYLCDDLRIVRFRLTASMLHNHPGLVVTEHKIYLLRK